MAILLLIGTGDLIWVQYLSISYLNLYVNSENNGKIRYSIIELLCKKDIEFL